MQRELIPWGIGIGALTLVLASGGMYREYKLANTEDPSAPTCPHRMPLGNQCQVEIVGMSFTDRIEGMLFTRQVPDPERGEYRFAVVTLQITKPAGTALSLAAADLTLHYHHGQETDVAPCEGLSWFKNNPGAEAPIFMNLIPGPGFIKQTTGPAGTSEPIVYIDAVFGYMEADTGPCWICLGQPTRAEPFVCPQPAWTDEKRVQETTLRRLISAP